MEPEPVKETARIAANFEAVREKIEVAAKASDRSVDAVTLVAISKSQSMQRIQSALDAGQRIFGENRVQEAQAHWTDLRGGYPDLELHFVGHLQSNKVAEAVALFDVIQSVDRPKLARALAKEIERTAREVRIFVQVNIGDEQQKGGIAPRDAEAFIETCREEIGLEVEGLMCIPPADEEPSPYFALLVGIARRAGLANLSMGMSGDYEIAVGLGATHVRVGTAIFGERLPPTGV